MTMKVLLLITFSVSMLTGVCLSQEADPSPTPEATEAPTPPVESSPVLEPAAPQESPAHSVEPQAPPDLLPESNALPTRPSNTPSPFDLQPEGTKIELPTLPGNKPSAEQQENDQRRFRQIRTIAARNPYAIYLFDRAKVMKTDSSRRQYMRAYYLAMCNQMRRLEPKLKTTIDTFEAAMTARVVQHNMKPTVPPEDLARYRAAKREDNHFGP
jgi:hypothetical protein